MYILYSNDQYKKHCLHVFQAVNLHTYTETIRLITFSNIIVTCQYLSIFYFF